MQECNHPSHVRAAWEQGVRWEWRFGIPKITPALQITDNAETRFHYETGSCFISTVQMRWNIDNPVGHMVPFRLTLKSPLRPILLGIDSKDGVRQDHKPRGYTRLFPDNCYQTLLIPIWVFRNSNGQYRMLWVHLGSAGALSVRSVFPFLVMREFTSNSKSRRLHSQPWTPLWFICQMFPWFKIKADQEKAVGEENHILCVWHILLEGSCHSSQAECDSDLCDFFSPRVGPFRWVTKHRSNVHLKKTKKQHPNREGMLICIDVIWSSGDEPFTPGTCSWFSRFIQVATFCVSNH